MNNLVNGRVVQTLKNWLSWWFPVHDELEHCLDETQVILFWHFLLIVQTKSQRNTYKQYCNNITIHVMHIYLLIYIVLNTQLPSYTVIKEHIFMNYSMRKRKWKKNKQLIGYLLVIRCIDHLIFWDDMRQNDPTVVCKNKGHHFFSRLDDLSLLCWR